MGLKDSAAAFQRCVETALKGVSNVVAYIDDILVYGRTQREHDEALLDALHRLNDCGFRLNLRKCVYR